MPRESSEWSLRYSWDQRSDTSPAFTRMWFYKRSPAFSKYGPHKDLLDSRTWAEHKRIACRFTWVRGDEHAGGAVSPSVLASAVLNSRAAISQRLPSSTDLAFRHDWSAESTISLGCKAGWSSVMAWKCTKPFMSFLWIMASLRHKRLVQGCDRAMQSIGQSWPEIWWKKSFKAIVVECNTKTSPKCNGFSRVKMLQISNSKDRS